MLGQRRRRWAKIEPALVPCVVFAGSPLAPVSACFSHRLTAYKIVGHFFGLSYRKISGSNQVKNSFFRISNISVLCPHAQLRGRKVIKKLWTFFGPWGRDRFQSPPCWIFRVKQIHPSTASERTTRQVPVSRVCGGFNLLHSQTHVWRRGRLEQVFWAN